MITFMFLYSYHVHVSCTQRFLLVKLKFEWFTVTTITWLTVTEYLCHKWPRTCPICRKHFIAKPCKCLVDAWGEKTKQHQKISSWLLVHKMCIHIDIWYQEGMVKCFSCIRVSCTQRFLLVKLKFEWFTVTNMTWLTVTEYLCHKWPRTCPICRKHHNTENLKD
jgi:hypothetical protein